MIKLSDRLQAIADMIKQGETVADIGTDHGFLPISLWEKGISPHVILSDINRGPLDKAKMNIDKYYPDADFDLRLGSGLSTLTPGEADVIVIAGMGGLLIAEILAADLTVARRTKRLIMQPRNGQDKLREWLIRNHFTIVDEALVKEGRYICEIIVAEPRVMKSDEIDPEDRANPYPEWDHDLNYEISPILFQKNDPLLVEFLRNKIRIENKIRNDIKQGISTEENQKLKESEKRIILLQALLERSGMH